MPNFRCLKGHRESDWGASKVFILQKYEISTSFYPRQGTVLYIFRKGLSSRNQGQKRYFRDFEKVPIFGFLS